MPIKAFVDKLAREILQFGDPPIFPHEVVYEESKPKEEFDLNEGSNIALDKFKGKKVKNNV